MVFVSLFRTYFITAPNKIRPKQLIQVYVSVFKITHPYLIVTASIRQGSREMCSVQKTFFPGSSSLMQMQVRASTSIKWLAIIRCHHCKASRLVRALLASNTR